MKTAATFSELLQAYFTERLMQQRNASPLTIANYRDTFRLLIAFAHRRLKRLPTALTIHALDAPFVCRFLDYLEQERGNSPRSRNVRLAAIRDHAKNNYRLLARSSLRAFIYVQLGYDPRNQVPL